MYFGYKAANQFDDRTGGHLLGGGAHYYNVYATEDHKSLAVAPIEPQFYTTFLEKLGLTDSVWRSAGYPALDAGAVGAWAALRERLTVIFKSRPRDHWCDLFAGSDVCVTPVLTLQEAIEHPHNRARQAVIDVDGVAQNAPAPRFSRTSPDAPRSPHRAGADTDSVLKDWRIDDGLIARARADGALG
jgi:alpha-methylacyl-CoA racemase